MPQKDPSRTEKATPKRRNKAREEGNVPKSQELVKAVTTAVGAAALAGYMPVIARHSSEVFRYFLTESTRFNVTSESAYALMTHVAWELGVILGPILLFVALSAWICLRLQIGALWTTKQFGFKWSRFNLIAGLKNMLFSLQSLIRMGRSLAQCAVVGFVSYLVILYEFENFLPLYYADVRGITAYILDTSFWMVLCVLPPMFIIGGLDLWYTRYEYEENLKMTKQEVKDEHRNAEGDPQIKARQKQEMMKVISRRMLRDVPKADVVITNPTHIAVALRYNPAEAPAPVVVAKGADFLAEKIKAIALEHRVPVRENVPLARALYKAVEVGDMIPEELYKAVASILAAIWRLKGRVPGV